MSATQKECETLAVTRVLEALGAERCKMLVVNESTKMYDLSISSAECSTTSMGAYIFANSTVSSVKDSSVPLN